jgi:hypothetical protein
MRRFLSLKKAWLLGYFITAGIYLSAQTHSFRFFPVNNTSLIFQAFIGKLDSHFFLLNRTIKNDSLMLHVYDTVAKTGVDRHYYFSAELTSVLIFEKSMVFIGVSRKGSGKMACHFLEVNEQGDLVRTTESIISTLNLPLRMIHSTDQKHVLFYQYARKGNDTTFVQGSMISWDGNLEKELMYSFTFDKEKNAEPEIFLDNAGNTHIMVFDKPSNYRISTDLTINSIAFADKEIVSETFMLQKVKLKTMRIFQNKIYDCLQIEGLYADGMDRITSGLYSLTAPFNRKNELSPRFIPFSREMIKDFKGGYSATDATIRNSLELRGWVYSDSGSFAMLALAVNSLRNPRGQLLDASRPVFQGFVRGNSPLAISSNRWNASKQIFIKMGKNQGIDWQHIQKLDLFSDKATSNLLFLVGGEKEKISFALYQADSKEEPYPVWVSLKDGKPIIEKFPKKQLTFSPIKFLSHNQYGSLYMNMESGEGGIMLIYGKD